VLKEDEKQSRHIEFISKFLKRLVGTFSLRVGHASSAARLKVELAK
jgi:hypothetical protein